MPNTQPEWKILPLTDAKVSSGGYGVLTGYASTFGNVDSYGDTVVPGAYTTYLDQFVRDGFLASNHDWNVKIGTISSAKQDTRGLLITAEFHSTAVAQDERTVTSERLARGKSVGLSIGYQATRWSQGEMPDGEPVRVLEEIKLFETSLVAVPADSHAGVLGVKSHPFTERPSGLWFVQGLKSEPPPPEPEPEPVPAGESDDDVTDSPERFADHYERVLLEVSTLATRSAEIADLRAKAGRVLSDANRRRLTSLSEQLGELQTQIADLLTSTESAVTPDPEKSTVSDELEALYAHFVGIDDLHRDLTRFARGAARGDS